MDSPSAPELGGISSHDPTATSRSLPDEHRGNLGPISISEGRPRYPPCGERHRQVDANVLFPTPPLPYSTTIFLPDAFHAHRPGIFISARLPPEQDARAISPVHFFRPFCCCCVEPRFSSGMDRPTHWYQNSNVLP